MLLPEIIDKTRKERSGPERDERPALRLPMDVPVINRPDDRREEETNHTIVIEL